MKQRVLSFIRLSLTPPTARPTSVAALVDAYPTSLLCPAQPGARGTVWRGWHRQTVSPSRWRRSCDVECGDKAYVSRSGAQCPDTQDRCARYLQPSFAHAPCRADTSPGAAAFAQTDVPARCSLPCVSSGGPPTTCSCLHSSTAELPVRKWKSGCSQLPRPAWWTLKAGTRSLLALSVGLHPQRIQRPLGLLMARTTVARRWTRRAVFGNFVAAMFTPEGDRAWWSSIHYIIMVEKRPERRHQRRKPGAWT